MVWLGRGAQENRAHINDQLEQGSGASCMGPKVLQYHISVSTWNPIHSNIHDSLASRSHHGK